MTWPGSNSSHTSVTVALLIERRVALRWHEAVAITLEIAEVLGRSGRQAIPTHQNLALTPGGRVAFLGGQSQFGDPVTALAQTLGALLPLLPKAPPTQLQLFVSVAGPNSVSYQSVAEFTEALGYFERPGRQSILSEVYRRAVESPAPAYQTDERGRMLEVSSEPSGGPVRTISIRDIRVRAPVEIDDSDPLVESVRTHGVLQPILVRSRGTDFELIAGSKRLAAARAAGLTALPCRVCDVDERETRVVANADEIQAEGQASRDVTGLADSSVVLGPVLGEIADSLKAATSCWLLSVEGPERPYSRTVNELTRAELQRATWIVEALQLLTQRPVVAKTRVNIGTVLEQVFRATESERRLADVKLSASLADASMILRGDEQLLIMALGGTLLSMVALVSQTAGATIHCRVAPRAAAAIVEFSQESVVVAPSLLARFFDETCHGRPGGYAAAVALAAANRVVELHGGESKAESLEPRGCRVSLMLPA